MPYMHRMISEYKHLSITSACRVSVAVLTSGIKHDEVTALRTAVHTVGGTCCNAMHSGATAGSPAVMLITMSLKEFHKLLSQLALSQHTDILQVSSNRHPLLSLVL